MFKTFAASIILALAAPTILSAGPFGVEMGMRLDELNVVKEISDGLFIIRPENPNPDFEHYAVQFSEEQGVCSLAILGHTYSWDPFGENARRDFNDAKEGLSAAYGEGKNIDRIDPEGRLTEERHWVASLYEKEREFLSRWDFSKQIDAPHNLFRIMLSIEAEGADRSYVTLRYDFSNFGVCLDEMKAAKSQNF